MAEQCSSATDSEKQVEEPRSPSRRRILALGATAVASLAAIAVTGTREAEGATGEALEIGVANQAGNGDITSLAGNVPGNDSLVCLTNFSTAKGHALSVENRGGFAPPTDPSGAGPSFAIMARSVNATGTGMGAGHGIVGQTGQGNGVTGIAGDGGIGMMGVAPGNTPAVLAVSGDCCPPAPDGGVALRVVGKALFSTAGSGTIPAGTTAYSVPAPCITDNSHVTVTFTSEPRGVRVGWIKRKPGTGFVIRLSSAPVAKIGFTYLVIEPDGLV